MSFEMGPMQKKWVAALRSGDYVQGRHALKIAGAPEERYCCLGVLVDCNGGVITRRQSVGFGWGDREYLKYLSDDHMRVYGLKNNEGKIEAGQLTSEWKTRLEAFPRALNTNKSTSLAVMNDSGYFTFDDIADFIEAHAEHLFTEPK